MSEGVKEKPHLMPRFPNAGFKTCAFKIHGALRDTDLGANIVLGKMRLHGVQTLGVSGAFAHPFQLLSEG